MCTPVLSVHFGLLSSAFFRSSLLLPFVFSASFICNRFPPSVVAACISATAFYFFFWFFPLRCRLPTPRLHLIGPPCITTFYVFLVFSLVAGAPRRTFWACSFLLHLLFLYFFSFPLACFSFVVGGFSIYRQCGKLDITKACVH